jgi:hypothetical protein
MDEAASLDAIANVLTALSENPYDRALHAEHIRLAHALGAPDQLRAAREMLADVWACADDVWLPMLDAEKVQDGAETPEGAARVLELYARAEQDYLCACMPCAR